MRTFTAILSSVPVAIVLSTITWIIMYYTFPDVPLTAAETTLIVLVFTVLTSAIWALLNRRKTTGKDKGNGSAQ